MALYLSLHVLVGIASYNATLELLIGISFGVLLFVFLGTDKNDEISHSSTKRNPA